MKKLVLFDIDCTLFNRELFRNQLYPRLAKVLGLNEPAFNKRAYELEEQIKKRFGYFVPQVFLEELHKSSTNTSLKKLEAIFWDPELYISSLNPQAISVLEALSTVHHIPLGVFSKGDPQFQEKKIAPIKHLLRPQRIYIYPNKVQKLPEVLRDYKDYQVFLVDDLIEPLEQAKKHTPTIYTIQINSRHDLSLSEQENHPYMPDLIIEQLSEIIPPIIKIL